MNAVYQRELKSYFNNMVGYIVIAFVTLVAGIFCNANNLVQGYPNFEYILPNVSFVMLFVVPILTMRSVSEEKHQHTDQLLYALPLGMPKIILGKYLAMLTVFAIPCGIMAIYPLVLSLYGTVSFLAAYGALLAFFLLGAALIAIGLFMSSLTESQMIAAVLSFGAMLLCYLMQGLASLIPTTAIASYLGFTALILLLCLLVYVMTKNYWTALVCAAIPEAALLIVYLVKPDSMIGAIGNVLNWLALYSRMDTFIYSGLFDLTAIVYYLTVAAVFVFFTVQSMEKKRWS